MAERILITGGAGFIGRRLARTLLEQGAEIRVLDNMVAHGPDADARRAAPRDIEMRVADIRDKAAVTAALRGVDKVVHLAAEVGVGPSLYAIERYVSANDLGTAILMEALAERPVQRIVVASSMSIYGEGLYRRRDGRLVEDASRPVAGAGDWRPVDDQGHALTPVPTPEWKRPALNSVYALSKFVQERMVLTLAQAYGMHGVALRLFNVYGPGRSLSHPYGDALALFASRLLNGKRPLLFEDGLQRRDFIHVQDVADAFALALNHADAPGKTLNIGSGRDRTIEDVALMLARALGRPDLEPEATGKARAGDIRHCFADTSEGRRVLGFTAKRDIATHLDEFVEWVRARARSATRAKPAANTNGAGWWRDHGARRDERIRFASLFLVKKTGGAPRPAS